MQAGAAVSVDTGGTGVAPIVHANQAHPARPKILKGHPGTLIVFLV